MNYEVIAFVVAFLCCGALVTVYILWLAGVFSSKWVRLRSKPQSFYEQIITDAVVLKKVEEWLEGEVIDERTALHVDGVTYGRYECAESLLSQIAKWRNEVDITTTK